MPEPDGVIYGEPALAGLSMDERRQYALNLVKHGLPPRTAVMGSDEAAASGAAGDVPSGIFDPASLREALEGRSERYTMPNGQALFVHPCSLEEALWLNAQTVKELRGLGLAKEGLPEAEQQAQAQDAGLQVSFRALVWQVVACCRVGPEPSSAKVFLPQHAELLRRNPGYVDTIQEIAAISNRLSAGKSETALLKEALTGFFARMGNWAATLLRLQTYDSAENSLPKLAVVAEALADFAASVSALNARGTPWGIFEVQALEMVLGVAEE